MYNLGRQGLSVEALRRLLFLDGSRSKHKPDVLVLGGSVAWDTKFGNVSGYVSSLSRLLEALQADLHRVVWIAPVAIHNYPGGATSSCTCAPESFAFMNYARSELYSALGTALAREARVTQIIDAWAMTVGATGMGWSSLEHYDSLYVPANDGFVSREITNALLNVVCSGPRPRHVGYMAV